MRSKFLAAAVIAGGSLLGAGAHAHGVTVGDTITAVFSNPILEGNVLNLSTVGNTTFLNNTGTAVFSGIGTNKLEWGNFPGVTFQQGTTSSRLIFVGAPVPQNFNSPFTVGAFTFLNGTSALSSLIFGATIGFYAGNTFLGSDQIVINTTVDRGRALAPNADYINVCGQNSTICNVSLNAYENTQTAVASELVIFLTGSIQGNPNLILTGATLSGNQAGNGFIGNNPPLGVPEPTSLALLGAGLAGLGFVRRRRAPLTVA